MKIETGTVDGGIALTILTMCFSEGCGITLEHCSKTAIGGAQNGMKSSIGTWKIGI